MINVDGKVCAFCFGERLNVDTMVVHIMKARNDMDGLYTVILNEFLKRECTGFKYVNLEQDLGMEGLRKSKTSYHPIKRIKKYIIDLAPRP